MRFYDKLVYAKNSVYQALIWIRLGTRLYFIVLCKINSCWYIVTARKILHLQ